MLILRTKLPNIEIAAMTSRTPIRLTHYRGPLATPSTSPESSPTLSTPPTDISDSSKATRSAFDIAILQHRISTLSLPARHQHGHRLYRRGREEQGLFGRSTHISRFSLIFKSLVYSTNELAKTLAGIVTFCLIIWGLLELVIGYSFACIEETKQLYPVLVCIRTTSATKSLDSTFTVSPCISREIFALPRKSLVMRTKRPACCGSTVLV